MGCTFLFVLLKTIQQVSQQIMGHFFIDWICFRVSTHVYNPGERGNLIILCIPGLVLGAYEYDGSNGRVCLYPRVCTPFVVWPSFKRIYIPVRMYIPEKNALSLNHGNVVVHTLFLIQF